MVFFEICKLLIDEGVQLIGYFFGVFDSARALGQCGVEFKIEELLRVEFAECADEGNFVAFTQLAMTQD